MLWIYVKINHNSSRDVHRGTAANRAFSLHDPRAYRLPAIRPPRGLRAEMILKREVLMGLKMTLLSRWVIATTECWLLLKTEGECRKETAALRSRCVPGISPRCLKRVLPQSLSEYPWGQYHVAKTGCASEADRGTTELCNHSSGAETSCGSIHFAMGPPYSHACLQKALLKSCEKCLHHNHSAAVFPGSQHWFSKTQQAEGKQWVQFKEQTKPTGHCWLKSLLQCTSTKPQEHRFIVERQV